MKSNFLVKKKLSTVFVQNRAEKGFLVFCFGFGEKIGKYFLEGGIFFGYPEICQFFENLEEVGGGEGGVFEA